MKFVLVQIRDERVPVFDGISPWRATHVKACGNAIDIIFWACCVDCARRHVRDRFPSAVFSDEVLR